MRIGTIAALPLALALLTACGSEDKARNDGGQGGEAAVDNSSGKRSFALTGFTEIEMASSADVTVRRGETFSIVATGPQSELDLLEIEQSDQRLEIGRKRTSGLHFGSRKPVKIAITMPRLTGVDLTGSGEVDVDQVDGDAVTARVTGSGDLKIGRLTAKTLKLAVTGSGDLEIAGGTAEKGDYSITGSGNIEAEKLVATALEASVTGSGDIDANASGTADISILGSGDVTVAGTARCTTSKMGSGTAHCGN